MDQEITHDIEVAVQSFYLDNESDPEKPLFLFAYRVRIENQGYETVQLLKRHASRATVPATSHHRPKVCLACSQKASHA